MLGCVNREMYMYREPLLYNGVGGLMVGAEAANYQVHFTLIVMQSEISPFILKYG